jgi:hypothetical protein
VTHFFPERNIVSHIVSHSPRYIWRICDEHLMFFLFPIFLLVRNSPFRSKVELMGAGHFFPPDKNFGGLPAEVILFGAWGNGMRLM